jgi:hypothetical protein
METSEPYMIAFENDYVRIVHVNLDARPQSMKYAPASTPMVRVIIDSDDPRLPRGSTHYCESLPDDDAHSIREIRVELKSPPNAAPMKLDAVRVDPARYKIDFENDRVRIVRLGFGPHEKGMMVEHPPRVLVTLTDVAVKLRFADGHTDERGAPAGVAAWLEGETLLTENANGEPLEVVLIEPKANQLR